MHVVLIKLKENFTTRLAERPQLFRIHKAELQERELATARTLLDRRWISHLAFDYSEIEYRTVPAGSAAGSQLNFHNQVLPASSFAPSSRPMAARVGEMSS